MVDVLLRWGRVGGGRFGGCEGWKVSFKKGCRGF